MLQYFRERNEYIAKIIWIVWGISSNYSKTNHSRLTEWKQYKEMRYLIRTSLTFTSLPIFGMFTSC